MKHFSIGQEVRLTKEYNWIVLTNDEQCYKYDNFTLGSMFTIIKSEKHGFILERGNNDRFFFHDDFMQEYFDIKTDIRYSRNNDEYFEFIEECCPSFRRTRDGKLEMFSCPTQWIKGDSAKELLDIGVRNYKQYGNMSAMNKWIHDECEKLDKQRIEKDIDLTSIDLDELSEYLKDACEKCSIK